MPQRLNTPAAEERIHGAWMRGTFNPWQSEARHDIGYGWGDRPMYVVALRPPSQSWSEAVERRQAAAALERAAATPVPDDNMMNLRRRITG